MERPVVVPVWLAQLIATLVRPVASDIVAFAAPLASPIACPNAVVPSALVVRRESRLFMVRLLSAVSGKNPLDG